MMTTLNFLNFEALLCLGCSSHSLHGSFCSLQAHLSPVVSAPTSALAPTTPTPPPTRKRSKENVFILYPSVLREIVLVSLGSQKKKKKMKQKKGVPLASSSTISRYHSLSISQDPWSIDYASPSWSFNLFLGTDSFLVAYKHGLPSWC